MVKINIEASIGFMDGLRQKGISYRYKPSIHRNTLLNKYPESISRLKKIGLEQFNNSLQQEELKPEIYNRIFGIPNDNQLEPQVRLGQKSLDEKSLTEDSVDKSSSNKLKRSELKKVMNSSFLDAKSKEIIMDRVDDFSEEEQVQIFKLISQTKSTIENKKRVLIDSQKYILLTHQMLERVLDILQKKKNLDEKVDVFAYLNTSYTEHWEKIVMSIHEDRNLNFFQK